MKKLFTLMAFAVLSFGAAHAQSTTQPSPKAVQLSPTTQRTAPADATKRSDAEATAPADARSIVMTKEQVDAAIAQIEQQIVRKEGSEGYDRELYLKQIEALNNRRPKN